MGPFQPAPASAGVIAPTKGDSEVGSTEGARRLAVRDHHRADGNRRLFSFRWHPFAIDRSVDYSAEPTTLVAFKLRKRRKGVMLTVTESGFDQIPLARRAQAFSANDQGWSMMVKVIENSGDAP